MARRRQGEVEGNAEKIAISLKLPKKLLDRIDSYWKENSNTFTGRTHFIEEACSFYLSCEECPKCGRLNSPEAHTCSYCGEKLEGAAFLQLKNNVISELTKYDRIIESILSYNEVYVDLDNKIKWYLNKLDENKKTIVEALLPGYYSLINSTMKIVNCFLEYRKLYAGLYENREPLPHINDVLGELYPTLSSTTTLEMDTASLEFIDAYNVSRCLGINYAYYNAKSTIDNIETVNTNVLKIHWMQLLTEGMYLPLILENMERGLNHLREAEKMIDILSEIQTTRPISISRRELQD